jgi:hypothetical protein
MGYGQYLAGWFAAFMGYRPHGKDWMSAELHLSFSSSTLIVKKATKGKERCHEKRVDRFAV